MVTRGRVEMKKTPAEKLASVSGYLDKPSSARNPRPTPLTKYYSVFEMAI